MRRYVGGQTYELETIATADDNQVADGKTILSFSQAQAKVRDLAKQFREAGPDATKFTLKEAIEAYLSGNRGRDQHTRLAMHVLKSDIASRKVATLTESALANWRKGLPDDLSPATRKRIATDFRAALNSFATMHRKQLPHDIAPPLKADLPVTKKLSPARGKRKCSPTQISGALSTQLGKLTRLAVGKVTLPDSS
jgi:hypothetical protein